MISSSNSVIDSQSSAHAHVDPANLYWAVLDASDLGSTKPTHTQLDYLFENVLPCDLNDVHTAYAPGPDGCIEACAIDRETIVGMHKEDTLSITPTSTPDFIHSGPDHFNLLSGEFEATPVRQTKKAMRTTVFGAATLCIVLLSVGFMLRATALETSTEELKTTSLTAKAQALGYASLGDVIRPSTLDAQFTGQLRQLQSTRGDKLEVALPENAAASLTEVLTAWPEELYALTDSIIVTNQSVTITTRLEAVDSVAMLESSFADLNHWQLQPPATTRRDNHVQVTLTFEPTNGPAERMASR